MRISKEGLDLIKAEEGIRLRAYKCPAGVWTIGYGHTGNVHQGMTVTKEEAEELLLADVGWAEEVVRTYVKVPLAQHEFDALVSFTFNVGGTAFKDSTMAKLLNMDRRSEAAEEFRRWTKANGKVLPVLVARRKQERALFEGWE